MPRFLKLITGVFLLSLYSTSCGCATLFNSTIFEHAPRKSFVKVKVFTDEYSSTGSGVIINHIDKNTIILTAGHICKSNMIAMEVLDLFQKNYNVLGTIVAKEDDLCLIMVDGTIDALAMNFSDFAPNIGDRAYNIAAPMGIHAPDMVLMFEGYYQGKLKLAMEKHTSNIYSISGMGGSSGSPVFNERWEIVGIVSRGITDFQHIMISVDYERIKLFYQYSLTEQFMVDMTISAADHNRKMLDFIDKMIKIQTTEPSLKT